VTHAVREVRRPNQNDFIDAASIVARCLRSTPLVPAPELGENVWLKLETMQPTGSFKVRGALAALASVKEQQPGKPVVTASAGNHALGVAWAAQRLGISATIVVAETVSSAKWDALSRLPVTLIQHGANYDEAEGHGIGMGEHGMVYVSPYNDPHVIAGQATIGRELRIQLPTVAGLTVVAGAGGGGLLSGLAWWAADVNRAIRVVGVEAEQSPGLSSSVHAGHTVTAEIGETIADGLSGNIEPGSITVELLRKHGVPLTSVSEPELKHAIRWLAKRMGLVVEGAGAAPVAAWLAGKVTQGVGASVLVISGRNIALDRYAAILRGQERSE
jgi:threonine dehydratase